MEEILLYIQTNVAYAPYLIFGLLVLAGFNIPVSEDLMLFVSAILAAKNPDYLVSLFSAVFLGAYISDLICYGFMGRYLGQKIFKIKFFANMISQEKLNQITNFYKKYGVFTLIFGRFIPFGVRNGLFLTAGLGKMNAVKFALSDLLACTISCIFFFSLYYFYGESVIYYVKKGNMVIFGIALLYLGYILYKKKKKPAKEAS